MSLVPGLMCCAVCSAPCYRIHDNGGRVQSVYDFPHPPRGESSFVGMMNGEAAYDDFTAVKLHYRRLFVGMDPAYPGFGDGNTLLLELGPGSYYFVAGRSSRFFQLPPDEPIVEFRSPIGNSDVPYPFALSANYVFLLLEDWCRVRAGVTDQQLQGTDIYNLCWQQARDATGPWKKYWNGAALPARPADASASP